MLRLLLAISFMIMSMQVFSSDVVTYEKNLKALHLPNKTKYYALIQCVLILNNVITQAKLILFKLCKETSWRKS